MKYAAFLRGVNVGGNSIIKMSDLKKAFETLGFQNVSTYINSGNVIFESEERNLQIREKIEEGLSKIFKLDLAVVVRTDNDLRKTLEIFPRNGKSQTI